MTPDLPDQLSTTLTRLSTSLRVTAETLAEARTPLTPPSFFARLVEVSLLAVHVLRVEAQGPLTPLATDVLRTLAEQRCNEVHRLPAADMTLAVRVWRLLHGQALGLPVLLVPTDLPGAAGRFTDFLKAQHQSVQVRQVLADLLAVDQGHDPRQPAVADLTPPRAYGEPHATEATLLTAVTDLEDARSLAALLLLHVARRDTLRDMNVFTALEVAAQALHVARDEDREQDRDPGSTTALGQALRTLLAELPGLRLEALKPGFLLRVTHRPGLRVRAVGLLRDLHALRLGYLPATSEGLDLMLCDIFEDLEAGVQAGEEPDPLLLTLGSLSAVTGTYRAPGMGQSALVEIACELGGVSPLWGWQEGQRLGRDTLHFAAQYALLAYTLDDAHPEWSARVQAARKRAFAHLLAVTRQAGLTLPAQELIGALAGGRLAPSQPLALEDCRMLSLELRDLQGAFRLRRRADGTGEAPEQEVQVDAPRAMPLDPQPCSPDPEHVQEARTLLQGRHVLLLGGQPDSVREAAMTRALGLAGLDWVATDDYHNGLAAGVRIRPETALVILAVRWIGHAHNLIRQEARSRGVPFVMLPGGLNVSNVAWHVTGQVSRQLSA